MTGNDKVTNGTYADDAGIIPRVLYQLFVALSLEGVDAAIKCSFIELYNEDLRDLISDEESRKITITESSGSRKSTGNIRGQETVFIESAAHGLKVLQHGLRKRQVAETKMNDLSSRSHTIFTLTVYMGMRNGAPKTTEALANDASIIGKINLVDLAGSENIGKSGAENKRAREAGMINQSLLTLGRVINALVDKSPHIPYRESKLTRLLQDSLGGQTRTCIIAAISPAQINLEETLSTLEYASKAKSIKNKAQVGSLVSKTTLFKEWSDDFIRLRRDWEATRKKNGTYLTDEHYRELLSENDERQLRIDEQERKLVTIDGQLRSSREILDATKSQLIEAKRQLTSTSNTLSDTMSSLASTEQVLRSTKSNLSQETKARKAHALAERDLLKVGNDLIKKLDLTVSDLNSLQDAIERRDELDSKNGTILEQHGSTINQSYSQLETILNKFSNKNQAEINSLQNTVQSFKSVQCGKLESAVQTINSMLKSMEMECRKVANMKEASQGTMNKMLEGLEGVRSEIKDKITTGLTGLGAASEQVGELLTSQIVRFNASSADILNELGNSCQNMFRDLHSHMDLQSAMIVKLNQSVTAANKETCEQSQQQLETSLAQALKEEKEKSEKERQDLMTKFSTMMKEHEHVQAQRLHNRLADVRQAVNIKQMASMSSATEQFETGMSQVLEKQTELTSKALPAYETSIEQNIESSRKLAVSHAEEMTECGTRMREDIHQVIESQVSDIGVKLESFDQFVEQVKVASDERSVEAVTQYMKLDQYVQGQINNIQNTLQITAGAVKEFEPISGFKDTIGTAWNVVADDSHEVAANARKLIEQVKFLKDDSIVPDRRVVEYPAELPETNSDGSNGSNGSNRPLHMSIVPQPVMTSTEQQRNPLSDISKVRNEDPAHLQQLQLQQPTLMKEPMMLKKRRPGFLQVHSPGKKRSKTNL